MATKFNTNARGKRDQWLTVEERRYEREQERGNIGFLVIIFVMIVVIMLLGAVSQMPVIF